MKDQRKTEIKVGITVILGFIIFLLVFGWAKNLTMNSDRKNIEVVFTSVAGLEVGDPVTVNGVRKGFVGDIAVSGNKVRTKLVVDGDTDLKDDATFSVAMLDLMGGKKIEIYPGDSNSPLDYSAVQNGVFLGDISTAMAMLSSVQNDLVDMIREIKISLTSANKILADSGFTGEVKSSVQNLNKLTSSLNTLIVNNKEGITNLISKGNELTQNVNQLLEDNKDDIHITLKSVQETLASSKKLIEKFNDLADETQNKNNNLGKILYDDKLVDDLKATVEQLKELVKIFTEQLKSKGLKVDADVSLF